MKANAGSVDRVVRDTAGAVLIGLALSGVTGVRGWISVEPLAIRRPWAGVVPIRDLE